MKQRTKYIHEGAYVAEVDVEPIESDSDWAPYLSVEDATRLDAIRALLRAGNIQAATKEARIYQLVPILRD